MPRSPKAEVEITASSRTLAAKLREARAKFSKFGLELKKNIFGKDLIEKGFWGKAGAQMVGNLGSRAVSGFGELIVDQGKEVFRFNDALTRFGIAARKTPEEMQAIARSVREVSTQTGISADEVLRAGRAYIDLAGAEAYTPEMMSLIARAAQASGTEINDLTTVIYALHNSMKVPDNEMEATLSGLINQSKDGTVHFNQLAQEIIGIAPAFARFGVTGREGTNELAAMFQVIRGGFKDSAETATGMKAIFRGLGLHSDKFAKFGVQVFEKGPDGVKHYRQLSQIFEQIGKSKLATDPHLLMKAFGRGEGQQAYQLLVEGAAKLKEFEESAKQSDTIQKDLATYSASAAGRLSIAWEKTKNAIAEAMTPERIDRFVGAVERLLPLLGKTVEFISNAAGYMDHLFNGDSKEVSSGAALNDFVEAANDGNKEHHDDAVAAAKLAVEHPDDVRVQAIGEGRYGNVEGYIEAARKFLASEGQDKFAADTRYNKIRAFEPERAHAVTREDLLTVGKDMAAELAKTLAPLLPRLEKAAKAPIAVKVDGNTVVTAHRNATDHRTRPGG